MSYLESKKNEEFTGFVKINSRNGELSVIETNSVDMELSDLPANYLDYINRIKKGTYTGTIVFELEKGNIIRFAYTHHIGKIDL